MATLRDTRGYFRYACEPAAHVIRRCGGTREMSRHLGISAEAISQWNRPISKGGDDGRIPEKWWDRVADLAERKAGIPKEELLVKLRAASMNSAKQKGDRFERQVVADLLEADVKASKVPLSGAAKGWPGDVIAEHEGTGRWVIQCKITKRAGVGGRGAVIRFLSHVSFGVVTAGPDTYIAMRRGVFIDMVKGKTPSAVNVPRLELKAAALIAKDIEGHDALVFRKGGDIEWMAMVRRG